MGSLPGVFGSRDVLPGECHVHYLIDQLSQPPRETISGAGETFIRLSHVST